MESQSHTERISTIKEDNLEYDDDFDKAVEANIRAETVISQVESSQPISSSVSAEAMLISEAYPLYDDDYGHQHIGASSTLDIIKEQTEQTYSGEQFDSELYEQQLSNMQPISQTEAIDLNVHLYDGNGDNDRDLLQSDSVTRNLATDSLVESSIAFDNYQLNSSDPFKTPEHVVASETKTVDTDDQYFSSVPYETVSTNFGVDFNIDSNKADESSFNLLDLDSSQQYISSEMQQKIDESVEETYHSDHSRNSDDESDVQHVLTPNESTFVTSLSEAANRDAEHILINSEPIEGIAAKPPNLEHLLINDDSFSQNYCVDYKHSTDLLEQKQTENIERFEKKMENSDVIATSTSSGDIDGQCPFSPYWWLNKNQLHPTVSSLLYWRDPRKSGIVLAIGLILLISLAYFSIISVFAYASLAALSVTLSFRIYKNILQAVQKTSEGHPFKEYLEAEISPSNERVYQIVDTLLNNYNFTISKLRSVFLVEDIIDSLKFVILFWCLTYIGSWFNGLTLVILAYVAAFSLPKVYEMNKTNIDLYLHLACTQINEITSKIRAKIPFPARKEKDN